MLETTKNNSPTTRFLDEKQRFGYMKRGRTCTCSTPSCRRYINEGDSRLFDNDRLLGPFCLSCAKHACGFAIEPDSNPATGVDPNLQARLEHLETRLAEAQEQITTLLTGCADLEKTINSIDGFFCKNEWPLRELYLQHRFSTKTK